MRTFSFLLTFLGSLFVGNIIFAQSEWHQWYSRSFDKAYYESFGLAGGEAKFIGNSGGGGSTHIVDIKDFYLAEGKATHTVNQLNIDRFWVTSDTIERVTNFVGPYGQYGRVNISEFILQVGSQKINVAGERDFGNEGEVLQNVTLTDTSVSNGTITKKNSTNSVSMSWELSGDFGVENFGTIENAEVRGGTFRNSGIVDNLIYASGTFKDNGGKIGTLTLANQSDSRWGSVDNLLFEDNGLITMSGFVGTNGQLDFEGITVRDRINFEHGNVVLDMTQVISDLENSTDFSIRGTDDWDKMLLRQYGRDAFSAANIFFSTDSFEALDSLNLTVQSAGKSEVAIMIAGVWQDDWQLTASTSPEPATFALFSLGLAGLGLATRRRGR